eukprot:1161990-Pelagomonas_calceolata.AAC.9
MNNQHRSSAAQATHSQAHILGQAATPQARVPHPRHVCHTPGTRVTPQAHVSHHRHMCSSSVPIVQRNNKASNRMACNTTARCLERLLNDAAGTYVYDRMLLASALDERRQWTLTWDCMVQESIQAAHGRRVKGSAQTQKHLPIRLTYNHRKHAVPACMDVLCERG